MSSANDSASADLVDGDELQGNLPISTSRQDEIEKETTEETHAREDTAEDGGGLGVNGDTEEVTELGDEASVNSVVGEEAGANDRVVGRDVRAEVQAVAVEGRLRVGDDLSNVALDRGGDTLAVGGDDSRGVGDGSDRGGRGGDNSGLVSGGGDGGVDDGSLGLDVDVNDLGEELRETEAELWIEMQISGSFSGNREEEKQTNVDVGLEEVEEVEVRRDNDIVTLVVNGDEALEELRERDTGLNRMHTIESINRTRSE